MLCSLRICRNVFVRKFHFSANAWKEIQQSTSPGPQTDMNVISLRPIDKRLLVWSGKFKRIEDVPDKVSSATVANCHSKLRVKAANIFIVICLAGCLLFAAAGKKQAHEGNTLHDIAKSKYESK